MEPADVEVAGWGAVVGVHGVVWVSGVDGCWGCFGCWVNGTALARAVLIAGWAFTVVRLGLVGCETGVAEDSIVSGEG